MRSYLGRTRLLIPSIVATRLINHIVIIITVIIIITLLMRFSNI